MFTLRYSFPAVNRRFPLPLVVLCLLVAASAQQQGDKNLKFKLQQLTFSGSKRYTQQRLMEASGLRPGDTVSGNSLQEVANVMGRTGAFSTISFRFNGATAEFTTIDSPDVVPPVFENILWYSDQELANGIRRKIPLFDGVVPTGGEMGLAIGHVIEDMLKEKGIANAEVEVLPVAKPGQTPNAISFAVTSPRVEISDMRLEGVAPALLPELAKALERLQNAEYKRTGSQEYCSSVLKNEYRRRGYLSEVVTEYTDAIVKSSADTVSVQLTVKIAEGRQYRVAGYNWAGSEILPAKIPDKYFVLKPGEIANGDLLDRTLRNFGAPYVSKGYLRAMVHATPELDEANQRVTYQVSIEPGAQYHIRNIWIRLPDPMKERLTQLFLLKSGDVMDPVYVRDFLFRPEVLKVTNGRGVEWMQTTHDDKKEVDLVLQPPRPASGAQ